MLIRFYRSLMLTTLFFLFGISTLFLAFIVFPSANFIIRNKIKKTRILLCIIQNSWAFLVFLLVKTGLIKINADNLEKIKNIKNSIIVSSHPSYIDVVILISLIPNTTCFVAKKLLNNLFFKNIIKSVFLVLSKPPEELVEDAKFMLDNGFNILIFPTGRRSHKDEHLKIRKGAAQIALNTLKNISILDITTSNDFLQRNQPFYDAGCKTVEFKISYIGDIDIKEYILDDADEINVKNKITKIIEKTLYN